MAPEVISTGKQLFAALVKIAKWFGTRKKRDVANLQELANRKFSELDVIHRQFIDRVLLLQRHGQYALDRLGTTDNFDAILSELKSGVKEVRDLRMQEHDLRRERYEEAKAFEAVKLETVGMIHIVPDEVIKSIHEFLQAYSAYFENSALYQHELARVHRNMEDALSRLDASRRSSAENFRESFEKALKYSIADSGDAERLLRERWVGVARSYHLLNAVLLKHGFKRIGSPTPRPKSVKPAPRPNKSAEPR